MLNHLSNHFNETTTTNGAMAYKSTKSAILDLFASGGAMRNHPVNNKIALFSKAYAENPVLAMKTIFYLRDVRLGQGERDIFKVSLKHLAINNPDSVKKNIHLIPEFGRWDDLLPLLDTSVKGAVLDLIAKQLVEDSKAERPSLLAKWLPSENASAFETKRLAKIVRKGLKATPKQYRKLLSSLRSKISLVETKLTNKEYEDIDYASIPSKAGMVYRGAFMRNDAERYNTFLEALSTGEVKVNAGTLYPSDIVGKVMGSYSTTEQEIKLFEGQWNNLPDFIGDNKEESIVMADVSGSMYGEPIKVAISLAMYIAERNKGTYKDHFMTFSANPNLVKIQGSNIVEKVENISQADWGMNTNIESALQTILDVAVENNLPNEEVIKKIYIVSDMQFDSAMSEGGWYNRTRKVNIFGNMKEKFEAHGYDFPNIVFWNVNASANQPMTMNDEGVQLVSGYSPSILTQLLNADGKTPYDFMLDVIESERYAEVTA